jgi:enterochelin esterase-like enzyme
MKKDEQGFWWVNTPPAVPGFHYYSLLVDGVAVNDPASETYFGYNKQTSAVEVPEPGSSYYSAQPVPHGEVRQHWYYFKATSSWRKATVYTPPGYDQQPEKRYPVLYLQHGGGENETSWTKQGRAHFILDNLIAAGQAVPMLVVMDCGYTVTNTPPNPQGPVESFFQRAVDSYDSLLAELIPEIDASYRTLAQREQRAVAGLSMGAVQALNVGLKRLDQFATIGAFSGPVPTEFDAQRMFGGVFADAQAFNRRVRLLFFSAGTGEPVHQQFNRNFAAWLEKTGIRGVVYCESQGTSHEWQTWRRSLYDFAPRLFIP